MTNDSGSNGVGGRLIKVLCAPDSFKESLSAAEAAEAMAQGVAQADASILCDQCPVADGGEGSLDALVAAMHGTIHRARVIGPLGEQVQGRFGIAADLRTGIVELAEASGLALIPPHQRDPMRTTSYGTGQLIAAARHKGCETVMVCIGGSGTVDGGAGIVQALGGRFFDRAGRQISEPLTGGTLGDVEAYEPPPPGPRIRIACDVTNPLCGPQGAAAVYGPQKGATPAQVRRLDEALHHLAKACGAEVDMPGAGAAGGAGFGLVAMCGAQLERGIELVLDAVGFRDRCAGASLVLTGEGCLDDQSRHGKACLGVAEAAEGLGVPTIALVGRTGPGADACVKPAQGGLLTGVVSLSDRYGLHRSLAEPALLLAEVAAEVVRDWLSGRRGP